MFTRGTIDSYRSPLGADVWEKMDVTGPRASPPGRDEKWKKMLENGPVEIVDLPIKHGDFP